MQMSPVDMRKSKYGDYMQGDTLCEKKFNSP